MKYLGMEVRDKITGFKGVATGFVAIYLSGCHQYLVSPKATKDGVINAQWFDEQRLEQIGKKKITLDNRKTPGADIAPPIR